VVNLWSVLGRCDPHDLRTFRRAEDIVPAFEALTKPAGDDVLQNWPVSKRVNSSPADSDDETLIERAV
jgi:hypothetical protein